MKVTLNYFRFLKEPAAAAAASASAADGGGCDYDGGHVHSLDEKLPTLAASLGLVVLIRKSRWDCSCSLFD
jgi:hypothetical protein